MKTFKTEAQREKNRIYNLSYAARRREDETFREEARDYRILIRLAFPEESKIRDKISMAKRQPWKTEDRKAYMRNYHRERAKIDLDFKLVNYLRNRFRWALKHAVKQDRVIDLLGCSIGSLKIYLESKFETGMTWKNYGKWEIDHIMPCAIFDLTKLHHRRRCFHFSNLQPLWRSDNARKWCKVTDDQFILL